MDFEIFFRNLYIIIRDKMCNLMKEIKVKWDKGVIL